MTTPQGGAAWRKSSYSTNTNSCVEVARSSGSATLVRDTKNRDGGHLALGELEWSSFLATVKDGRHLL